MEHGFVLGEMAPRLATALATAPDSGMLAVPESQSAIWSRKILYVVKADIGAVKVSSSHLSIANSFRRISPYLPQVKIPTVPITYCAQ